MYAFDLSDLDATLAGMIRERIPAATRAWLEQKAAEVGTGAGKAALNITFASLPRRVPKAFVSPSAAERQRLQSVRAGFIVDPWTVDRLCRVWVLLQVPASDKVSYSSTIEELFLAAEMNELVALYSALPVLAYPESWALRCAEGIRSNIGDVLEAIMCDNPYPSEYLEQAAWNQLVLKAIFTEKPLHRIIGLEQRANRELAYTLSDFAHERWAAHRPVPPMLWRCVAPFVDERTFPDIQRLVTSIESVDREVAALVCSETGFGPAKQLLEGSSELQSIVADGEISWQAIAQKTELV